MNIQRAAVLVGESYSTASGQSSARDIECRCIGDRATGIHGRRASGDRQNRTAGPADGINPRDITRKGHGARARSLHRSVDGPGKIGSAVGLNIDFVSMVSTYDTNIYVGGDNVMFWGPMSYTIIFGLTFATFLTLVIVPVMYLILNKIKYRRAAKKWAEAIA